MKEDNTNKEQFAKLYYRTMASLELKTPAEKILFTIIDCFPYGQYKGSLDYLMRMTGIANKRTLLKYLSYMVDIGLLKKDKINGRKVHYTVLRRPSIAPVETSTDDIDILNILNITGQI